MTGVTDNIEKILPVLSEAECLKGWTLVGGTALAIQIGHRGTSCGVLNQTMPDETAADYPMQHRLFPVDDEEGRKITDYQEYVLTVAS